jgi:hypothetical protein
MNCNGSTKKYVQNTNDQYGIDNIEYFLYIIIQNDAEFKTLKYYIGS